MENKNYKEPEDDSSEWLLLIVVAVISFYLGASLGVAVFSY